MPHFRIGIEVGIGFAGLLLVLGGYFGPWVGHEAAALTVTGFELAEFAKFFPEVQSGAVVVHRPVFYTPLVAAVILLTLFAAQVRPRLVGWLVAGLSVGVLTAMLLPYAVVEGVRQWPSTRAFPTLDPAYRGQLWLLLVGSGLTLLTPLTRRWSRRGWGALIVGLSLVGFVPPAWQFARLRPLVAALYDRLVEAGWGLMVCGVGFGLLMLWGAAILRYGAAFTGTSSK